MMMMMMIMVVGELWLRIRKKNDCRDFWLVQSLNDNDDDNNKNNNLLLIVKSRFVEKFFFHWILCALVWYGGYFTTDYQKFGFFSVVHFGHKSLLLLLLLLFQDFNCLNLFPFLKGVHYICIEYGISSNSTITTATLNDVWRLFKTLNNNYFFFFFDSKRNR